jgi:uncharacterized protein (TIGR02246 family)
MKVIIAALAGAAVFAIAAAVFSQGKRDPALDKLAVEFETAFNARDAARAASMYTDDGILMPPDQPMIKGRADIEAYYRQAFKGTFSDMKVLPFESIASGTQAFEAGVSTIVVPRRDGGGSWIPAGKYVLVYKRVGQTWKIAYDIFNDDVAEPPPSK